jgi:AraC family transcriptional regulator
MRTEIQHALRFVAEHIDRPMTVAEVAKAVGLSEFHLHRVFHATVGESLGRFITRRRLENAALRLAYEPTVSITEIALSSGYSSSSNFSKAFAAYFGCSPSRVRNPDGTATPAIGKLTRQYGTRFRPEDLFTFVPEPSPDDLRREVDRWNETVRIVDADALHFASLASRGGYEFGAVHATWDELIARAKQLGFVDSDVDAWGIAHDSPTLTAPERCRYHACVPCPADERLPSPLEPAVRRAGRYAVFRYRGPVTGVADAYRSIYSCWFRDSSVVPDDFVPLDHYVGNYPKDGQVDLDLWLRIRSAAG